MDRIAKLSAALDRARMDEEEAEACGFTLTASGTMFYAEAKAIRIGIEKTLDEAILDELFEDEDEIAPGEFIPASGLIDLEDRF